MKTAHLVLAFLFLSFGSTFSQMVNHEDVVKVKFSIQQKDGEGEVIASIDIIPGWHINSNKLPKDSYAIATDITINPTQGISIGKLTEPKPIQFIDEVLGDMQSHHKGKLTMKRSFKVSSDKDLKIKGAFSFAVCNEAGICLQPHKYPFELSVKAFVPTTNSDTT
ncbi:MAG: hypothetical protein EBU82_05975, partial [Flavobacteriia bacterium]|nr:hypothetical protein [Flavobacteriia bacterium]